MENAFPNGANLPSPQPLSMKYKGCLPFLKVHTKLISRIVGCSLCVYPPPNSRVLFTVFNISYSYHHDLVGNMQEDHCYFGKPALNAQKLVGK